MDARNVIAADSQTHKATTQITMDLLHGMSVKIESLVNSRRRILKVEHKG